MHTHLRDHINRSKTSQPVSVPDRRSGQSGTAGFGVELNRAHNDNPESVTAFCKICRCFFGRKIVL